MPRRHDSGYRSYLLRVWTRDEGESPHATIQDVATGRSHAFTSLRDLHAWLEGQHAEHPDVANRP